MGVSRTGGISWKILNNMKVGQVTTLKERTPFHLFIPPRILVTIVFMTRWHLHSLGYLLNYLFTCWSPVNFLVTLPIFMFFMIFNWFRLSFLLPPTCWRHTLYMSTQNWFLTLSTPYIVVTRWASTWLSQSVLDISIKVSYWHRQHCAVEATTA